MFCIKIFLHETHGSCWITRSHKSQLLTYCLLPSKLPTAASFPLSRNSGESVHCWDKFSKITGRILAEYHWRIHPFGFRNHLRPSFTFPLLWTCTVPCSNIPCVIASSCSIWPHDIMQLPQAHCRLSIPQMPIFKFSPYNHTTLPCEGGSDVFVWVFGVCEGSCIYLIQEYGWPQRFSPDISNTLPNKKRNFPTQNFMCVMVSTA